MSTKTYFYPTTATVLANLVIGGGYPTHIPAVNPAPPPAPDNSVGGFASGFDIHDYNGDRGGANIFQPLNPSDPVPSTGVVDTLESFYSYWHAAWYLMRRTVFTNWTIAGIFTRNMDFLLEIDLECAYANGGFRDEAPNASLEAIGWIGVPIQKVRSPYGPTSSQGCGVCISVKVSGITKATYKIQGTDTPFSPDVLTQPRSTISIPVPNLSPTDLALLEVHVITEQFCDASDNPVPGTYTIFPHPKVETQIYRLGLAADPVAMRSSGKASAALTSR